MTLDDPGVRGDKISTYLKISRDCRMVPGFWDVRQTQEEHKSEAAVLIDGEADSTFMYMEDWWKILWKKYAFCCALLSGWQTTFMYL